MNEDEKFHQVERQCAAVAQLATNIARIHDDYAKMFKANLDAIRPITDEVGKRTAAFMELLGDMLNGMDAVDADDKWMDPIFDKAHELWPQERS
jgi:hypothetical protein